MDRTSTLSPQELLNSLRWIAPEGVLAAFLLLVIVADLTRMRKTSVGLIALAGVLVAGLLTVLYLQSYPVSPRVVGPRAVEAPASVFQGAYAVDGYSLFFKAIFLGAALLAGAFSMPAIREWRSGKGEYFSLLLACTFGMMLMASANDLLMMYLSLEFVSVTSYILAGLLRKNRKSAEASLKYIIYGAAASGMMVYGMTFLYGLTGTLEVGKVGQELARLNVPPTMTLITSVLVMAGFAYKIAAVPFHMWCPDVYEGAPTPVTAFFSVGPKAAGFAMLARFLEAAYPDDPGPFEWKLVMALLAVLTMAVGNFAALHQQNLKRLLAYSSIAHAGYILIAFNAFTVGSTAAMLVYLLVYVLMNLGAFLVVIVLEEKYGVETVDGCRGVGWRAPWVGAFMTVFLIALTGLPPTAGFTGKFLLFGYVVQYGLGPERALGVALVVIGVVFSVISLFYYMRIVAAMYLAKPREGDAPREPVGAVYGVLLALFAAGTLLFGVWWGPLQDAARAAAQSLHR
jgi:NADH-quinone oxidoreductase subunit N